MMPSGKSTDFGVFGRVFVHAAGVRAGRLAVIGRDV
jgi:hypothetical protein